MAENANLCTPDVVDIKESQSDFAVNKGSSSISKEIFVRQPILELESISNAVFNSDHFTEFEKIKGNIRVTEKINPY